MRAACRFGIAAFMAVAVACESNAPGTGAIDACDSIAAFKIDSTTTARLENTDCTLLAGFFSDLYAVNLSAQTGVSIVEESDSLNTYLELYRASGEILAANDDSSDVVVNSIIEAILPAGDYVLAPSSAVGGVRGPYTLTASTRTQGLVGCPLVWVTRGVTISDSITTNDCAQTGGFRADLVVIPLLGGTVARLHLRSTAFDARLQVRNDVQTDTLASNDDSTGTTDAWLAFTAPASDFYVIAIGTETSGETGAYTFEIEPAPTVAGARRAKGLPPRVGSR